MWVSALEHCESETQAGGVQWSVRAQKIQNKGSDWVTNGHGVFIDICEPSGVSAGWMLMACLHA